MLVSKTERTSGEKANLSGKSVLITGGASGLGLAFAHAASRGGAYVTIADIQTAEGAIQELTAHGYKVLTILCDTTDWDQQITAFHKAAAFSETGEVDVVAAFAAVDDLPNLVQHVKSSTSANQFPTRPSVKCLDINLQGVLYTATLALHYLGCQISQGSRDKSLIFISSLAGYIDDTHDSVYTAFKLDTRDLFRSIRSQALAELGVRCNLIAPGAIKTPMTAPILKAFEAHNIGEEEGITFASPETLVEAVMKCATDKSLVGRFRVVRLNFRSTAELTY